MKKLMNFFITFFMLFCFTAIFSSCTMPLTIASIAAEAYEKNQPTKVNFINEEKTGSTTFQKIAIWPDNQCEILLAENLQSKEISVVTPSAVGKVIQEQNLEIILDNLTYPEVLAALKIVCEKTGADIIIGSKGKKVILFSLPENKIVWNAGIQAQHKANSSPSELLKIVADLLSDKIIEFHNGKLASN